MFLQKKSLATNYLKMVQQKNKLFSKVAVHIIKGSAVVVVAGRYVVMGSFHQPVDAIATTLKSSLIRMSRNSQKAKKNRQ